MSSISQQEIIRRQSLLTLERLYEVAEYNSDTGIFLPVAPRFAVIKGKPLGHVEANGYRRICIDRIRYLAHRLAWFYVYKEWPIDQIDHINLCKDDNRIVNLRLCSTAQNHQNIPSKIKLKGAHWNRFRGYFQSYIKINGRSVFLGRFDTAEEAHAAYCEAARKYFGEFARLSGKDENDRMAG